MRTPDNYQLELEQIRAKFGDKGTLTWKEIQEYTGRGVRWCTAHLNVPHRNCTVVQLAKAMATIR